MDRDILLLPTNASFDAFLREQNHNKKLRHVVVTCDNRIVGVLRVNTAIRQGLENTYTGITLEDVASRDFTIAHEEDIMFGVIGRMWQRGAMMVIVVRGNGEPSAVDVLGVITKEHVVGTTARSYQIVGSREIPRRPNQTSYLAAGRVARIVPGCRALDASEWSGCVQAHTTGPRSWRHGASELGW
jgi:hypothetical protein